MLSRRPGRMPSRELAERYPGLLAIGGHPSVDMPPHVVEAAAQAARRAAYAPTRGLPALREAIAERIDAELGRPIDPDRQVLVTLGGMQGFLHLAAARPSGPVPCAMRRRSSSPRWSPSTGGYSAA